MSTRRKHNNGILEFRNEECRKMFQSALYKYSDEEYFYLYFSYITAICNQMGFYPNREEIKNSALSMMKTISGCISKPEMVIIELGNNWAGVILSIWMAEIDLDDPQERGLSILATILRELDYLKEQSMKL